MKCTSAISAIFVLGLVACDTMNQPISSGGSFDPLRPPGSDTRLNIASTSAFTSGQIVAAAMNNTAFFKNRPKGEAEADKLLPRGTSMKVVSSIESYVRVELDGTGEVGWVLAVQLEGPGGSTAQTGYTTNPGEYQVYPPLNGGSTLPLPPLDPAGLPPEGAIPTVIDPEASTTGTPTLNPPNDQFVAPVDEPKTAPAPLPPNGEELETAKPDAEKTPKLEE